MPTVRPASNAKFIGRFRVIRALGHGTEGIVYLAKDPKLDRDVAIKTLLLGDSSDKTLAEQLVKTASTASALSHPNIVPVFEAGMHEGSPYVVFEYMEGGTLAQILAISGPMQLAPAVVMMSQLLAGVAQMHERHLLHGDLKPANILIGNNGLARIADFGLLRRVRSNSVNATAGTLRYMAPECFKGAAADCRRDVYALGLIFFEMLTGTTVISNGNAHAQIYSIVNDLPRPPSALEARIPPEIDAIVIKALQKDPDRRYANAGDMKRELDRFRVPAASVSRIELKEQNVHGTVDFLVRRMAHKSDFPALSTSFSRINQISAQADDASVKVLSDTVMRDFALTQKLLRYVNSAAVGGRNITKVSQAITILGIGQLRTISTAMMLANRASGKNSGETAASLADAFVAGVVARNIGRVVGLAAVEELFICGMFGSLGELLSLYYLTDEHAEITRRIREKIAQPEAAARAVLGLTFEELGCGIAQHWKFPATIVKALARLPDGVLDRARSTDERLWHCAGYARELCALARIGDAATRETALASHIERFSISIVVELPTVRQLMTHSVAAAGNYISAAGLSASRTAMLDGMAALGKAPETQATGASPATISVSSDDSGENGAASNAMQTRSSPTDTTNPHVPPRGWRARLAQAWRSMF